MAPDIKKLSSFFKIEKQENVEKYAHLFKIKPQEIINEPDKNKKEKNLKELEDFIGIITTTDKNDKLDKYFDYLLNNINDENISSHIIEILKLITTDEERRNFTYRKNALDNFRRKFNKRNQNASYETQKQFNHINKLISNPFSEVEWTEIGGPNLPTKRSQ